MQKRPGNSILIDRQAGLQQSLSRGWLRLLSHRHKHGGERTKGRKNGRKGERKIGIQKEDRKKTGERTKARKHEGKVDGKTEKEKGRKQRGHPFLRSTPRFARRGLKPLIRQMPTLLTTGMVLADKGGCSRSDFCGRDVCY